MHRLIAKYLLPWRAIHAASLPVLCATQSLGFKLINSNPTPYRV
jgi:hypothetical protein